MMLAVENNSEHCREKTKLLFNSLIQFIGVNTNFNTRTTNKLVKTTNL